MGFGNWKCKNSQSEDPYALEIDDDNDSLTRPKRKQKSVVKQKKILKNCSSNTSVDLCRPQQECFGGSLAYSSQDFLPQINGETIYRHNIRIQVSEKPYRFFKSRNTVLLSGENLKSGINSKCTSQVYSNVGYTSEIHSLEDTGNEEKDKSFNTQDVSLFPRSSIINQNITDSLTATKTIVSPKENIFSLMSRIFPYSSLEETTPALSKEHALNLGNVRKCHHQNSQIRPQIAKPFTSQKYKSILHKQQKKTLAKSNKFFKSRDRNAISNHNLRYFIRNSCAYQDRKKFNIEQYKLENGFPTNTKLISRDPYSLEIDDSYSNKQNEEFKHVNTENMCKYENKNRPSTKECPLSSKLQSNCPYLFEMNGGNATTLNTNFKCRAKERTLKSSSDQLPAEAETFYAMHKCMQSANAPKAKMSISPGTENLLSSKIKAVNQPSIDNLTDQYKEESYFPIIHTRANETLQPTNESDEILSLPKSSRINFNLYGKRRHQVEINHISSSVNMGKNRKSSVTAVSSRKCSIGYTYVITDTLSLVTQKRKNPEDTNTKSIYKEKKDTHGTDLTLGNINCKKDNTSSKETCKLLYETNAKFSPVIRNLAKLNIHCDLIEKKHPRATNATDSNDERYIMPSSCMAWNKTIAKPSLEIIEFCTPKINTTPDANYLKSLKQAEPSSSCISFAKNNTEMKISHGENLQNGLIIDQFVSKSAADEIGSHFKKTVNDFKLNYSSQQKKSQKMLRNTFTDGKKYTKSCQNTTTISSHENYKMKSQLKIKDNKGKENLIKLQANTIPTNIKTSEKGSKTECSTKQAIYTANKKKGSNFKKCIYASNKRKKSGLLYRHKWVDDVEANDDTKLTSNAGLLVQPVGIISSDHGLENVKSPLLCIASKHIKTAKFTNKGDAVMDLNSNEIDKKYFTVIKNVRKSDQIQQIGKLQEYDDDIEYMLDALQENNPITTRCQSALMLASKCLMSEFRMHVKAHDTMTKFCCALHDAAEDQSLALCAATVIFILSEYQIITYTSSDSIHLLLSLFNSRLKYEVNSVQLQSIKKRVLEICAEVQSKGFIKHLHHENITANYLVSEALLRLTSCNTGHLFEDCLREMGGLKHIIMAITNFRTELDDFFVQWRENLIDKLRFLNCCLQILVCITDQNEENKVYLLNYESSCFMGTMAALLSKCTGEMKNAYKCNVTAGAVTLEVLLTLFKILINLTYSNGNTSSGSSIVSRRPEMIHASLYVLLEAPSYIPEENKFDLLALVLMFLINVVEQNTYNRKLIFEAKASDIMIHNSCNKHTVKGLIELFHQQEKLARIEEFKTSAMLDGLIDSEHEPLDPSQEFIATIQEKAGQNMEYTMIASYIALLIGYLIVDNEEYEIFVRQCLPQKSFSTMIAVLEKMYNFFNTVPAISSKKDITQTQLIIQYLKQSDKQATGITYE